MWIDDEKLFEILASPYHWRKKAEQMKKVGDILKIEMERQLELLRQHALTNDLNVNAVGPMVGETCFAMYGFSLELILKGAIIFSHPEYAHDGKINRAMTNHDLIKLAGLAQVDLTDAEKVFCSNTTRIMLQFRYPVPSKMEETQFQMVVTGNFFDFHQSIYNRVLALIDGFNYVGHDENNCPKCLAVKAKEKLEVNDINRK